MAWSNAPYVYTYGVYYHSVFTIALLLRRSEQYGWRPIAGTENYTHTYLHGDPMDTHINLKPCYPDGRTVSYHSLLSSSSSSKPKEPTNYHGNDYSPSSTSSSLSSSSSSDEQSSSSSSSSSASATKFL
ncbi:hypothetical protein P691DRAFT_769163 [Macrolepiota fuliginosa MF-IS2]|uniref:Uncharacterized protein n=1 Tax=Macrolepiota fuliginosa MF-IS2 TaxID=1400762 RepID=A0A9P5WVW3_9AGAR|nr:hypothetical protein P691DRAFT_769163 [Macrolepiota fuliginosa MF-IS2]